MSKKINIAILGSTGSIGTQALNLIRANRDVFQVEILTANTNVDLLAKQAKEFNPSTIVITDESKYKKLSEKLSDTDIYVYAGNNALTDIVSYKTIDIILSGIVGIAGLDVLHEAAKTGKRIALANKEPLVVAGDIIMNIAKKHNTEIIPVDSEHSAIFQCLQGEQNSSIKNLYLTASGGPFFNNNIPQNIETALKHPNWQMGAKISIDSATLMNKVFEIIEANKLFGINSKQISVLIHPESVIHSLVRFVDGSIKAQLSKNDMRMQIQYAFTYPYRLPFKEDDFDILKLNKLQFLEPDEKQKRVLNLAYYSLDKAGNTPTVLNAANELLVQLFLQNKINIKDIITYTEKILQKIDYIKNPNISDIKQTDTETRKKLLEIIKKDI